jgi:transposase-like protein
MPNIVPNACLKRVFKRLHYPFDVILLCVRWYVAYPLSLRHLEEMMAERGLSIDHSTVHRWAIKLLPLLEKTFRRHKRPVGKSWRMDETYIKVKGNWKYLYRTVDKDGNTVDFLLRAHRDKAAAQRYFEKAIARNDAPRMGLSQTPRGIAKSLWSADFQGLLTIWRPKQNASSSF